jgi:hypothetical protein
MTQTEIDRAVAAVTGESRATVHDMGSGIADPLEVEFDPEPRRPLVFDWGARSPAEWPGA